MSWYAMRPLIMHLKTAASTGAGDAHANTHPAPSATNPTNRVCQGFLTCMDAIVIWPWGRIARVSRGCALAGRCRFDPANRNDDGPGTARASSVQIVRAASLL